MKTGFSVALMLSLTLLSAPSAWSNTTKDQAAAEQSKPRSFKELLLHNLSFAKNRSLQYQKEIVELAETKNIALTDELLLLNAIHDIMTDIEMSAIKTEDRPELNRLAKEASRYSGPLDEIYNEFMARYK